MTKKAAPQARPSWLKSPFSSLYGINTPFFCTHNNFFHYLCSEKREALAANM
jgi:hypothetical protein